MNVFQAADILLPQVDSYEKWAVIACDQFTSDPGYWVRVRKSAEGHRSTMHMILPEAELGSPKEDQTIRNVNDTMWWYLNDHVFRCHPHAYIYVERTLTNGMIRPGLIGVVDLEQYDYSHDSTSLIRATEKTVLERIPPRQKVRRNAPLEFPHILMLCDDDEKKLIEPIRDMKDQLPIVYDFDLMEHGGHIAAWLLQGQAVEDFDQRFEEYSATFAEKYADLSGAPVLLAVGDGNHSLATAKSCYEELKASHPENDYSNHPARYALVELENIHDPSLVFEAVHRVVTKTDAKKLLSDLRAISAPDGYPVRWFIGQDHGIIYLDPSRGELAVAVLQSFLDQWLQENPGSLDYVHGDAEVEDLAEQNDAIGLILPAMEKHQLFRGVVSGGILPRKTFSMGHAREKRYYLEGRRIK